MAEASLDLAGGEILAILGENGAGKSTLMKILAGHLTPDRGSILSSGKEVRFRHPADALACGIGMVHQHFALVPTLSATENIVLGKEPRRSFGLFDSGEARRRVADLCNRLGFELDLSLPVEKLSVGARQKVELLKILHRGARTLILDEPTAVLTATEVNQLFALLRELRRDGAAVAIITHKLEEVRAVSDRVVVMRAGRTVFSAPTSEASEATLAAQILGAARLPLDDAPDAARRPSAQAEILELREVTSGPSDRPDRLRGLSLVVRTGEICGVAGVEGNGQRALSELLCGLDRPIDGALRWRGVPIERSSPSQMRARGVRFVPEDRHALALLEGMTVEESLALGRERQAPFAHCIWIDRDGRHKAAQRLISVFGIKPESPQHEASALSGGNQQKMVLARALDDNPSVLVLSQPTRGLDLHVSAELRRMVAEACQRGLAVIWLSSDLDELLEMSDLLYVIHQGKLSPPQRRGEVDLGKVVRFMTSGVTSGAAE